MKRFLTYLLLASIAAFGWSCIKETAVGENTREGKDIRIQFRMAVPSAGGQSRALDGDDTGDEVRIEAVDIPAFVKAGDGKFRYAYSATNINRSGTESEVEVVATVKEYPAEQIFLILCNAADELTAAGIRPNEEIDDVLVRIQCGGSTAGEWPAKINGSPTFKPFPMYARTSAQVVSDANNDLGDFPLVRMVARADITLKSDISNFVLVDARVYNRAVCGYVPYDFSGWNGTTKRATSAGVPAGNAFSGRPEILASTVTYEADDGNDPRGEILRSIYLFESEGVSEADRLKGTAIIVGGKYGGSGVVTYYRIDIKTDATPAGYVSQDILRNHWYQIEIQSVAKAGAQTPEDAYKGDKPIEFTVSVTDWGAETYFPLGLKIQPASNCYITNPNTTIEISVIGQIQRAIDAGHLASAWVNGSMDLKAFLVWAENANVINTSNLKMILGNSHNILYSTLSVTTGNTEGNALVAVYHDKDGNGVYNAGMDEIKWSWHIWVMADNNQPQEVSGWMDRDLGMLRRTWVGTPGNKNGDPAIPLYYQWGRKEPFTQTGTAITEPGGRLWGAGTYTSVTSGTGNTLATALQNPARVITDWTSPAGMYCWRTQSGGKGIYDPCPVGYRVPSTTEWEPLLGLSGKNFTTSSGHRVLIQTVTGLEWVLPLHVTGGWYHSHSRSSTDGCRYDVAVWTTGANGRIEYRPDGGEETQRATLYPVRCIKE